jgi:hypothetical protein
VDDVADVRTRLIYASLEDDELVRRLRAAQRSAAHVGPAVEDGVVDVRDTVQVHGTRPWPTARKQVTDRHPSSEWCLDDPSYYLG